VCWNDYIALYSKFPAESASERIFKIGLDLTKLLPKVWWRPFLGTQCICAHFRKHFYSLPMLKFVCRCQQLPRRECRRRLQHRSRSGRRSRSSYAVVPVTVSACWSTISHVLRNFTIKHYALRYSCTSCLCQYFICTHTKLWHLCTSMFTLCIQWIWPLNVM